MAILFTSIDAHNLSEIHRGAQRAWQGGAHGVELRLDRFSDDPGRLADYLRDRRDRIWILTCRGESEGGQSKLSPADRSALLAAALHGNDAFVDFEFDNWPDAGALHGALSSLGNEPEAPRLVVSRHYWNQMPLHLEEQIQAMLAIKGVAAAKVAYRAEDAGDVFPALDLMHEHGRRVAAIGMGEAGMVTRILAAKLGAFASYCSVTPGAEFAPGQLPLEQMLELYGWPRINESTQVFGVVGDPVAHSMSPRLFNTWFEEHKINAVYVPFLVRPEQNGLALFLDGWLQRPWLDLGGVSVTIPHKVAACRWAGPGADRLSRTIGAVNTLVFSEGQRMGFNTDCYGAVASLVEALGGDAGELAGLTVDVLGCGGAARAVIGGLRQHGSSVTVYGRSASKLNEAMRDFDCKAAPWEDRTRRKGDVVVNCTSVGMWPAVAATPMPVGSLGGCRLVFDLVYNPRQTELLQQAAVLGAATLGGLDMFLRQAAIQFELWLGSKPDMDKGRRLLERLLQETEDRQ